MDKRDSLREALTLLRQTSVEDLPASLDIGELFIAELRIRRKRLIRWLRLLNVQASQYAGQANRRPYKCRRAAR
jgi:hypothetical protein